jgi:predicted ribosome quality control (RQC) complex YloA/Tae2 family protein
MQRKLSSFDIYVIVSELQNIIGNSIDKIYQITRNELLIRIRNIQTKQKEAIYIRNGDFLCLTKKDFQTPEKPSIFAMTLRKYLSNGRINKISQHEFDRIIKINISKKDGEYTLIIEFFSDGNIILVNPEGKIILPLIKQRWAHRSIRGKEKYEPPPSQINPFEMKKENFSKLIKESDSDIVRTLAVNVNLSGPIAEEICARADVDKTIKIQNIDEKTITKLYDNLISFLEIFKKNIYRPVLVKKYSKIINVLPFQFKSYTNATFERAESFTKSLEIFTEIKKEEKKKDSKTSKLIGKLNRQLLQQKEAIEELTKKIEIKKFEGNLIYLNYKDCEQVLNEIKNILELKEKNEEIKKINEKEIVKKFDPTKNLLILNLKNIKGKNFEINLNFRKSVSDNAEKAYDDSKKLRNKLSGAEKSLKKTLEQIKQVKEKEQQEKEQIVLKPKKEKHFWFERFRWFISSDGNIIVGGKDIKTNELVVKKYLKENDRYAHADIQGAPSIIIKGKGLNDEKIEISEKTMNEACIFAASFSKAWKQFAEAQAYWVLPEQVSKTPQSGEFVPKGAFIIRGKRNYYNCKLELAVGLIKIDDVNKIMCGPVGAVKSLTDKYVIIQPGDIKKIDIAHKLAKAFDEPVDKVDRVIPPGGATIVESVGLDLR